jgi:hypothetical protein
MHGLFVDDMAHASTSQKKIKKFMKQYLKDFEYTGLVTGGSFMTSFLGLEFEQDSKDRSDCISTHKSMKCWRSTKPISKRDLKPKKIPPSSRAKEAGNRQHGGWQRKVRTPNPGPTHALRLTAPPVPPPPRARASPRLRVAASPSAPAPSGPARPDRPDRSPRSDRARIRPGFSAADRAAAVAAPASRCSPRRRRRHRRRSHRRRPRQRRRRAGS